jgi:MFS family permease
MTVDSNRQLPNTDDVARVATLRGMSPWMPAAVVVTGAVATVLDTTIVNVALHDIGVSLRADSGVEWVVGIYLLAVCASMPITGWLADRFGRNRVLSTQVSEALAVATLSAVIATESGAAPSGARAQSAHELAFLGCTVGLVLALYLASLLPRTRSARA